MGSGGSEDDLSHKSEFISVSVPGGGAIETSLTSMLGVISSSSVDGTRTGVTSLTSGIVNELGVLLGPAGRWTKSGGLVMLDLRDFDSPVHRLYARSNVFESLRGPILAWCKCKNTRIHVEEELTAEKGTQRFRCGQQTRKSEIEDRLPGNLDI